MAGMAMAETVEITNQLKWNDDENVAELNGLVTNEATVVVTLRWSNLIDAKYDDIFTFEQGDTVAGIGIYKGVELNLIHTENHSTDFGYVDAYKAFGKTSVTDEASLVFTIAQNSDQITLNGYLYLWSDPAKEPNLTPLTYTTYGVLPSSNIVFNKSLVKDIQVFTGITDDPLLLATNLKNYVAPSEPDSPTIPEPTTATLSLLALAGLAVRRRRR